MVFERILILDDDPVVGESIRRLLQIRSYSVVLAGTVAEAERQLAAEHFDLLFLDVRLPDGDGTELLHRLNQTLAPPLVVVMTGFGSVDSAVDCMRQGAFDYFIKPVSLNQIEIILKKAEEYAHMVKVNRFYSRSAGDGAGLLGESPELDRIRSLVRKVAPTGATVLIMGESGTGKELIASEIFAASDRADRPFIKVNCAAVAEGLIESEFFGHEKGAFTGATQRREGRFELANGGTILLDEISEISPAVQAKLLRVLQEQEFERVGGVSTVKVDVRVIATTNRNLGQMVAEGAFREDLFYRLNVFPIVNAPLRERVEDILPLATCFLAASARKHGAPVCEFDPGAREALLAHDWPGNVRELQNTIERAVILAGGRESLPAAALGFAAPSTAAAFAPGSPLNGGADRPLPPGDEPPPAKPSTIGERGAADPGGAQRHRVDVPVLPLAELEKRAILRALEECGWNRTRAAERLAVTARTLRNKLRQYRAEGETIPDAGAGR